MSPFGGYQAAALLEMVTLSHLASCAFLSGSPVFFQLSDFQFGCGYFGEYFVIVVQAYF